MNCMSLTECCSRYGIRRKKNELNVSISVIDNIVRETQRGEEDQSSDDAN